MQAQIIVSLGLQRKSVEQIAADMVLEVNQVMAFFGKAMKKVAKVLSEEDQKVARAAVIAEDDAEKINVAEAMDEGDDDAEHENQAQEEDGDGDDLDSTNRFGNIFGTQFALPKTSDPAWKDALAATGGAVPREISVKRGEKPPRPEKTGDAKKMKKSRDRSKSKTKSKR